MTSAAHYRQLVQLGREGFVAAAAPAALVRFHADASAAGPGLTPGALRPTGSLPDHLDETLPLGQAQFAPLDLEVYPLAKKPGAAYPDRITIGRTSNNDIAIPDASVSRLHAYLRRARDGWVVADAGSKNGSTLRGGGLDPRREVPIASRATLRLGDVELTFYHAQDLYLALGGSS